ncbi:MAG: sigma-54 dependent transcriptional regulator [Terriglobia bacterium]
MTHAQPLRAAARSMVHSLSLITRNETLRSILARVDTLAASDSSVLLIGETGVGKELFAEYIHRTSNRAERPLVKVGLAALPHELLETELFGHERGAFTSAHNEKKGLFELSDRGTIFLDDIDDFPLALQSKLLRVLESHEVMRVGGTTPIPVDIRLITATKVDLKELVNRGIFRADLYYRINVVPISIPPMRERRDDIPLLIEHFLRRFAPDKQLVPAEDALRAMVNYSWPGNVRELRNVVQRMALFASETIELKDLPPEIRTDDPLQLLVKSCHQCLVDDHMSYDQVIACLETNLLRQALDQAGGNRAQAAKALGMSLSTFRDKLKKYHLDDTEKT